RADKTVRVRRRHSWIRDVPRRERRRRSEDLPHGRARLGVPCRLPLSDREREEWCTSLLREDEESRRTPHHLWCALYLETSTLTLPMNCPRNARCHGETLKGTRGRSCEVRAGFKICGAGLKPCVRPST